MKTTKTMRSILLILSNLFLLGIFSTYADEHTPIEAKQLPSKVQKFIKSYFPKTEITMASMEKDFLETSYKVVLSSGAQVEFHNDGEWKEVKNPGGMIPAALIPAQIAKSVKSLYPGTSIVEMDKNSKNYEVTLSNGYELTYNFKFKLIDIDD